jgi:exosortase
MSIDQPVQAATNEAVVSEAPKAGPTFSLPKVDWNAITRSPAFVPSVIVALGILFAFWGLVKTLPGLWANDEYYSHGFLMPLLAGFVFYKWWPWLREVPARPSWLAGLFLLPIMYLAWISTANEVFVVSSAAFLLAIWFSIGFIAGWRWMMLLTLPVFFLAFALPIWQPVINEFTNPLQLISAQTSVQMLKALGYDLYMPQPTMVQMNNFLLDVGVPCSGLKMIIALTAFTLLFMMVGSLSWWANLVLMVTTIPLAIFINGLRITMIGMVGEQWGADAGHKFHDYSGYIALIVCFFILFKLARLIGWKD